MSLSLALFCILAGGLAAGADVAGRRRAYAAAKVLAATSYLAFAVSAGAMETGYGRLVVAALALSWLGDLFLIGRAPALFLAGLGAFLLAHVAYASAFAARGVAPGPAVGAGLIMAGVGILIVRWLSRASLPARMRGPVTLYVLAIGVMVALAAGAAMGLARVGEGGGAARLLGGAILFAGSDVLVARERFVRSAPVNRLLGLPLYFVAQLLLASTAG